MTSVYTAVLWKYPIDQKFWVMQLPSVKEVAVALLNSILCVFPGDSWKETLLWRSPIIILPILEGIFMSLLKLPANSSVNIFIKCSQTYITKYLQMKIHSTYMVCCSGENTGFEFSQRTEFCLSLLLVWFGASCLVFLTLSFLIYKIYTLIKLAVKTKVFKALNTRNIGSPYILL